MTKEDLIAAFQEGKGFAVDIKGVEHIGTTPDDVRQVIICDFSGSTSITLVAGQLPQKDIAEAISAISKLGPCWCSFEYDTVDGIPAIPVIRYYAPRCIGDTWMKLP